jgi:hypothetical protein
MKPTARRLRYECWAVFAFATAAAVVLPLLRRHGWNVPAVRPVLWGVLGLIIVNIGAFSFNLLLSMPKWLRARNEEEVWEVAEPALRGAPSELGLQTVRVVNWASSACLGLVVGGIAVAVLRWVR